MAISTIVSGWLMLAALVASVRGYHFNRRKLLVAGALLLFLSVAGPDFVQGFLHGAQEGWQQSDAHRI